MAIGDRVPGSGNSKSKISKTEIYLQGTAKSPEWVEERQ